VLQVTFFQQMIHSSAPEYRVFPCR